LDGLAVISDIVASNTPREAAARIASIIKAFKALDVPPVLSFAPNAEAQIDAKSLIMEAADLLEVVRKITPLVHQVSSSPLVQ